MTDAPHYPLEHQRALVQESDLRDYLELLFSRVLWKPHSFVCVRGIGEKHTPKEGHHQEDIWIQPGLFEFPDEQLADRAVSAAQTWAQHHIATFIVPCVLREARGTSQSVELFTALMVDLDSGDTHAKAAWVEQHIGTPTMVVTSGGTTEAGTPKLHLYWVLDEPSEDIAGIVELRHQLALKAGGDLQFGRGTHDNPLGRAHQPIRIPGTVHAKGGNARTCRLLWSNGPVHELLELGWKIRNAPAGPWAPAQPDPELRTASFDFGPSKNQRPDIADSLLTEVHEGGEDRTRWNEFNRVAGYNISLARQGLHTLDEAREATFGWMLAKMVPPWPEQRFKGEWHKLVGVDASRHGPMPVAAPRQPLEPLSKEPPRVDPGLGLKGWALHLWTQTEPPPRRFLVDGLVVAGKPHLLVAEGGAGKTFSMLELALKVGGGEPGEDLRWMGQRILEHGTVVILTTEDDADELHIRTAAIDQEGRRFKAGTRVIVYPAVNAGGAFTLVKRLPTGETVATPQWLWFMNELRELPDVKLIIVDTLNTTLHGEENSATVVNEYARALQPVCGDLGAALIVTHHIRKQDTKFPIRTADDMAAAVRGSSALPNAFRAVLGFWHCHDFAKRMQAMGLAATPKALWRMGVLKANNEQMLKGIRFLLRGASGLLEDVTEQASSAIGGLEAQRTAWLVQAVRAAAVGGVPYQLAKKDGAQGLYARRQELHPCLREDGYARTKLLDLVDRLVTSKTLVMRQVGWLDPKGRATLRPTLDVPGGPFAAADAPPVDAFAAYLAPDWEREYEWNEVEGWVVPVGAPRLVMGRADKTDRQQPLTLKPQESEG